MLIQMPNGNWLTPISITVGVDPRDQRHEVRVWTSTEEKTPTAILVCLTEKEANALRDKLAMRANGQEQKNGEREGM